MMALTASTPVLKGRLADMDCRWGIISESVDWRTPAKRGTTTSSSSSGETMPDEELVGNGQRRIQKSRYDSISTYIYPSSQNYNDIPVPIDENSYLY